MTNPRGMPGPPPLGLNIDWCINQLPIERAISHLCPRVEVSNFSRSTLNEKLVFSRLIKVASLTIFCVPLPSYNFIVSIKDDFYCEYFALRDER